MNGIYLDLKRLAIMTKFITSVKNQQEVDFYNDLFQGMQPVYEVYNTEEDDGEEKRFQNLKQSLEEAIAYQKGELNLITLEEMIDQLHQYENNNHTH